MSERRRRTILFAWELGGGLGHTQAIRRQEAQLRRSGVRCIAVVRDLAAASGLAESGVEVLQAPIWPRASMRSVTDLASLLDNFGVADPSRLRLMLAAWGGLINRIRPDLIVADYAPGATLAARGRVPVLQCSDSFPLPPDDLDRLPTLLPGPGHVADQPAMLASINTVLVETGRPPLSRLAGIFSGLAQVIRTFPVLDIYGDNRASPAIGPFIRDASASAGRGSGRIVAYLDNTIVRVPGAQEALRPFAARLRIFAPLLSDDRFQAELAAHGATFHTDCRPISQHLSEAALFISHGSATVTAEALAAGVPHLSLPYTMEKLLNGGRMQRAGVGRVAMVVGRTPQVSADDITAMLEDESLADRTAEQGDRHRRFLSHDPLQTFNQACLAALDS